MYTLHIMQNCYSFYFEVEYLLLSSKSLLNSVKTEKKNSTFLNIVQGREYVMFVDYNGQMAHLYHKEALLSGPTG